MIHVDHTQAMTLYLRGWGDPRSEWSQECAYGGGRLLGLEQPLGHLEQQLWRVHAHHSSRVGSQLTVDGFKFRIIINNITMMLTVHDMCTIRVI